MNRARNKEAELLSVAFILILRDSMNSLPRGIKNRKESKNPHDTSRDSILYYYYSI